MGKAAFIPAVRPYLNSNKACMEAAWNNFNEVAEGFGLNQEEFRRVLDVPGFRAARADADRVFEAFDTDENNLVDALEFLTTFALTSAMTLEEKVAYTFRCYDFDESGELTVDEMTLSMKSTLTGLAKMTVPPSPPQPSHAPPSCAVAVWLTRSRRRARPRRAQGTVPPDDLELEDIAQVRPRM